jgi:hypothetical protein
MLEATMHALRHPVYCERALPAHQEAPGPPARCQGRPDRHRQKLTEAIWHMLTTNQPFNPTAAAGGAALRLAA